MLTHERLLQLLTYDPVTGVFRWRYSRRGCSAGAVAGRVKPDGYRQIMLDSRAYYAQRLALFYVTGEWPEREVDHKDGCRDNNAWSNLRDATRRQNMWNTKLARLIHPTDAHC